MRSEPCASPSSALREAQNMLAIRMKLLSASVAMLLCASIAAAAGCGAAPDAHEQSTEDGGAGPLDSGTSTPSDADAGMPSLGVNDVSYLFPLPKAGEDGLLLRLDAVGASGALLPREVFAGHIQFLWEGFQREMAYDWSRVIALRLDPCGGQTVVQSPASCRPEIRLSVQPLSGDDGMTSVIDAAVHLIYQVSRTTLDAMLSELLALKATSSLGVSQLPLGPHPIMVEQGLGGAFARGVNTSILKYVGVSTLSKFTFMGRGRNSTNWSFHLVENHDGVFSDAPIPAAGDTLVQGVNELGIPGPNGTRDTTVTPVDEANGYPRALWKSEEAKLLSAADLQVALGRLAKIEDPAKLSSLTLDCGSCHLTSNARTFYERLTGATTDANLVTFVSPPGQNTSRHDDTALSAQVVRAFGYLDKHVAISQRTINESARVADWLSRSGP
jgi:hypothetical protein